MFLPSVVGTELELAVCHFTFVGVDNATRKYEEVIIKHDDIAAWTFSLVQSMGPCSHDPCKFNVPNLSISFLLIRPMSC